MKKIIKLLCAIIIATGIYSTAFAACPSEPGCSTNWLNVPGDFSQPENNFSMNLLGGWFSVDTYTSANGTWLQLGSAPTLDTTGNQFNFTASQFDHFGDGQGTSVLNANFNHVAIGSGVLMSKLTTIYLDGAATGTLVDNATSTQGHWTLNAHLFADWGALTGIDLGLMQLSTDTTYTYHVGGSCTNTFDCSGGHDTTTTGSLLDYHSGLTYFVGQGVIQNNPYFNGLRVTIGLQGQDPLVAPLSAVPIPAASWLLGSGLLGLVGAVRKRQST